MTGGSSVVLDAAAVAAALGLAYALARGAEQLIKYFTSQRREAATQEAGVSSEALKIIEALHAVRSAVEMHDATETQRTEAMSREFTEHRKAMAEALQGLALGNQQLAQTLTMLSTLLAERKCVAAGRPRRRAKAEKRRG